MRSLHARQCRPDTTRLKHKYSPSDPCGIRLIVNAAETETVMNAPVIRISIKKFNADKAALVVAKLNESKASDPENAPWAF